MMVHPTIATIERRASANLFDASQSVSDSEIEHLVRLATRAPTAYNLQNWRFIAVRSPEAKGRLRALAHGQFKVEQAAVTFVICGALPNAATLPDRLKPCVEGGYMPAGMPSAWQAAARARYGDPRIARDEAVRSAALGAATLIFAAEGLGFASGPMGGFDADGVAREFALEPDELPVMLVAVGRPAPGNWPQKPRRPLAEVLEFS
ncbi:MAG TPA: nitroreductase family protein [Rhizobiaceae bacterium]|nr:nitroreductase family protein [Rhizobiaceae bacterium]